MVFTLTTGSGSSLEDPSEDGLLLFIEDIERGDEQFIIVGQDSDARGQTYMQTIRSSDEGWIVEFRNGSADTHVITTVEDMVDVHALIFSWMSGKPELAPPVTWRPLDLRNV